MKKFIQAVTLVDIVTTTNNHISHQSYDAVESSGWCKELRWLKVPTKDKMPPLFIILWKSSLNKCFIDHSLTIDHWILTGLYLDNWVDQNVKNKWMWWFIPGESQIYQQNKEIGPIILNDVNVII